MMKKILLYLFVLVIISCNDNPMPKPDKMLSQEEMENILFDVTILQAAETSNPIQNNFRKFSSLNYIYKKYNIDSTIYFQNHRYYAANVRKYKKIFKNINDRLQDAKKEMDSSGNKVQIIN